MHKRDKITKTMRAVLIQAARPNPGDRLIGGPMMKSANILAQRGYITLHRAGHGWQRAELTETARRLPSQLHDILLINKDF
jgi:hypothetical protein